MKSCEALSRPKLYVMCMRDIGDPPRPYHGINGEYRRDLEKPGVYYKKGSTTAMWWCNYHSRGRWMVGPASQIGSNISWAYCNSSGK